MRSIRFALLAVFLTSLAGPSRARAQLAPAVREPVASGGPTRPERVLPRTPLPGMLDAVPLVANRNRSARGALPAPRPQDASQNNRRRNVLAGAVVGAVAGALVTASVCSDSDGICLFSPAVLFPIGGAAAGMLVALLLTPVR